LVHSEYSKTLNDARLKVLAARETAIQSVVKEARARVRDLARNPGSYKKLLQDLLVQVGLETAINELQLPTEHVIFLAHSSASKAVQLAPASAAADRMGCTLADVFGSAPRAAVLPSAPCCAALCKCLSACGV
jgi:V-type H+-transporting ATPase subunit E